MNRELLVAILSHQANDVLESSLMFRQSVCSAKTSRSTSAYSLTGSGVHAWLKSMV